MHYLNIENIKKLNIDLNTICQAACPGCARQHGILNLSSAFPNNTSMSFNTWKRILDGLPSLEKITYCGNYGDAAASKTLPEYIDYANEKYDNLRHVVISNMGIGSETFWKELICRDNVNIIASVDGLENTNHLYRRFVRWDIVERNLKIISSRPESVTWSYIVFPWNECDIGEAKSKAEEFGFKFRLVYNNQPEMTTEWARYNLEESWNDRLKFSSLPKNDKITMSESEYKKNRIDLDESEIVCRTQNAQSIHVDWAGKVYPCCWYGGAAFNADPNYRNEFYSNFPSGSWNDINKYSWKEILNHKFFNSDLVSSWKTNPSVTCMGCSKRKKKYD